MKYKEVKYCRVCHADNLVTYFDLGLMPLSNNLAKSKTDPIHDEKYPLKVQFCEPCGLSQLSVVVDPKVLFGNYVYRSSISQGYINHCRTMALSLQSKFDLKPDSFHIDIAGNDGALLKEFKKVIGGNILNVDPATNLSDICEKEGIPIINYFWSIDIAKQIKEKFCMADLITATNVFAHVDDVTDFMQAVKLLLKKDGILVLEFPYLIDFIDNKEFDTIYFEHLSYFSIYPLKVLCDACGINIMNVEKQNIHGGSVRVIIGYGEPDKTVLEFIANERIYYSKISRFIQFADESIITINSFSEGIRKLNGSVAGFAASAKGNILLNCSGLTDNDLMYIVDETPEKIGNYSPGTRIPIISMECFINNPPDYLVILSWNFKEEIINKCRLNGYLGKFIIPIPDFKITD